MQTSKAIQVEKIRKQFPPDWEVPAFQIEFWEGKENDYCVVVPVINEGDRIRQFVRRLQESHIDAIADIILVDGGSTDGSLDVNLLRSHGIRCLLTKTGPGRLSAQLRVAYSFAVVSGYSGVITIDGNNKDDPSPIQSFIDLLQQGYDLVQASRFIKGGIHRNTPLARYLAIRLFHAPILALSSGYPWTDTTQGFRAYSRRCLTDSRVKPFRSVFVDYQLLAYLSYRIPRIGMRCIEYPTSRIYPQGRVPTKISGLLGMLKLLKELVLTCVGFWNPD